MFRKRRLTNPVASRDNPDPSRREWVKSVVCNIFSDGPPPAKRQRIIDGVKILLDIAKESSDLFVPLKSALGGITALIKHYEVFVE